MEMGSRSLWECFWCGYLGTWHADTICYGGRIDGVGFEWDVLRGRTGSRVSCGRVVSVTADALGLRGASVGVG